MKTADPKGRIRDPSYPMRQSNFTCACVTPLSAVADGKGGAGNRGNISDSKQLSNLFSSFAKKYRFQHLKPTFSARESSVIIPKIGLIKPYSSGHHRAYKYNKRVPAYSMKGRLVTRMQIIAKAVLAFVGLSAIANLCQYHLVLASTVLYGDTFISQIVLFLSVFLIVTIAIAYLFIFKNDWLVYKIAGSGKKLNPERETLWLAGSLRMAAVLYGLILLATSMPTILNIIVSPLYIFPLINEILTFKTFPKSLIFTSSQWSYMIYNFLKAILAVYLLYGWPHFIRFQLNIRKTKSPLNQKQYIEGIENE